MPCARRWSAGARMSPGRSVVCSSWTRAAGALLPELEELRAEQNAAAEAIAQAKRAGEERTAAIAEQRELGSAREAARTRAGRGRGGASGARFAPLPNLPDPTAAPGPEDELVREVGEIPTFAFEPRDHLELAGDGIDMDRAARLSGARFAYLKGDLVMLELALVRWVLEKLRGNGFEPVIPPVLVRERALYRDRLPARHRAADLLAARGRAVPRRHLRGRARLAARRGDPGRARACRCATPASRPASAARPARRGKTRGGSSACTSSTRWRCSASSRPRSRPASTSGSSRSRRRSSGS